MLPVLVYDWLRGLTCLSMGLGAAGFDTVGDDDCLVALLATFGPGSRPNLGKSNWKFTSLRLLRAAFPSPLPAR